jgi:hypothetical protein
MTATPPSPIITGGDAPVTIAAGTIQFYDRFAPPLQAGAYSLSATQTVGGVQDSSDDGTDPSYNQAQRLYVNGPRFNLSSTDVFAKYPPANAVGDFHDHLAHVVFQQRTMPWTRDVVDLSYTPVPATLPPAGTPWMALLTFYSADLQTPGNSANPNAGAPVAPPATGLVSALLTTDGTVLVPQIKPTDAESAQQVVSIDVDYTFFLGIAPSQRDLPLLAHGRQVNTEGKALAGDLATGFFSLAVSNRVVNAGDAQLCVLVSLEGHWTRLPGGPDATSANAGTKIRLVVLASWAFATTNPGGDFLAMMTSLTTHAGGVDLLRLPSTGPTANPDSDAGAQATQALALGYAPLTHDLRAGETTTSFYRGPAAAVPCATDTSYGPFYHPDGAVFYDPTFGTFNLSYAAAFEVGRLLAVSDGAFATNLIRWRNDYFYRLMKAQQQQSLVAPLANAVAEASGPDTVSADYGPRLAMHAIARQLWHAAVATPLLSGAASIPRAQLRHVRAASPAHPGVLTDDDIETLHATAGDPIELLESKLAALRGAAEPGT